MTRRLRAAAGHLPGAVAWLVLGLHVTESVMAWGRVRRVMGWLDRPDHPSGVARNRVHLLIPLFREPEHTVRSSIEHFGRLASHHDGLTVTYVTTEKEGRVPDIGGLIRELAPASTIVHVHCPLDAGHKAHQINWAMSDLLKGTSSEDESRTYIGMYDADSSPDHAVIDRIRTGDRPVYQQPSIFLRNYAFLSAFQQAGALLQMRWELAHNVDLVVNGTDNGRIALGRQLPSCTGHGLFVRADVIRRVGAFAIDTTAEDIEFGYRLAFSGVPITYTPEPDVVDFAPRFAAGLPQTARWFSGEMRLASGYGRAPGRSWQLTVLVAKRYYVSAKWAVGPAVLLASWWCLARSSRLVRVLTAPAIVLYLQPACWTIRRRRDWIPLGVDRPATLVAAPLRAVAGSLGPLAHLLGLPTRVLFRRPLKFAVTPRL